MPASYQVGGTAMQSEEPLEFVDAPYLPPKPRTLPPYTLVLDLDETLVHYFEVGNQGKCLVRPGVHNFLESMSHLFEIVIFTAALKEYADWVLDQIDPNGFIKHRLYRQHALPCGPVYIKVSSFMSGSLKSWLRFEQNHHCGQRS